MRKRKRKPSIGIRIITAHLKNCAIKFTKEYRIKECRDRLPLPFDVALFLNGELIGLIEFQGIQHYQSVRRWKGKKGLLLRQAHDKIKFEYCRDNRIPLLVVSYLDDVVEKLMEFLTYIGL